MTDVRTPAMSHRTSVSRSGSSVSNHNSTAVAVKDVIYPPPAFIDQAAQAGLRTRTEVIQKLLAAPRSLDWATNKNSTPTVQSASMASFRGSAPMPKVTKLRAAATASTDEKA